jgi:hypothetical protein
MSTPQGNCGSASRSNRLIYETYVAYFIESMRRGSPRKSSDLNKLRDAQEGYDVKYPSSRSSYCKARYYDFSGHTVLPITQ